jgi:enoyl-CoA hydratase/carnithine racemase
MSFILKSVEGNIAKITLNRGKVNPINEALTEELLAAFEEAKNDAAVRTVIITGRDKFFSFGLDIPEFLSYPKADFIRFQVRGTLYIHIFVSQTRHRRVERPHRGGRLHACQRV